MKPSERSLGDRFSLACVCAFTMYACAAAYGAFFVYRSSATPGLYLGVILGLPALAAILFIFTAVLVPNLLAPRRLVFPLNLTLPPVYAAYVVLSVMLLTSTGSSLILPYDRIRAALFWTRPGILILVTLSQILCLSVLALFRSQPVD